LTDPQTWNRLFPAWILLRQAYMLMMKNSERALASHDLSMAQYMTLVLIKYSSKPVTPTTVAHYLSQETPSVTYGLDRLEAKGLLKRVYGTGSDRREVWLEVTPEGSAAVRKAMDPSWGPVAEILMSLNDSELEALSTLLGKLRDRGAAMYGANRASLDFALHHLRIPDEGWWESGDDVDGAVKD
jgi:DNA-binding MarR family transcriptional regulator